MTRARDLAAFVSNADGDIKFDTDTLFIDSSANRVAIGNTAPSRPLHITANPAMILLEDSDGGSNDKKAQIQVDSGAFEVNARNDDDSSRTDNILVADLGTGDIGISTNVPDGKLHVYNGMLQVGSKDGDTSVQQNTNSIRIAAVPNSSTEWGGLQWYREFSNYIGAEIIASRPSSTESDTDLIFKTSSTSANATERMRILNGGGLTFNGDTAAANALDDYEEGTWTPSGATGFPGGGAPSTITATYTKIGDTVSIRAVFNAYNDGTTLSIGGLPFAAAASSGASIANSNNNTFTFERVGASSFGCVINGTNSSLKTFYLAAVYRTTA
jgi:hypothetical protein